jgi:hypothetical protein
MTDKITSIIASAESDQDKALMVLLYLETEKNSTFALQGEVAADPIYSALSEAEFGVLVGKMQALIA